MSIQSKYFIEGNIKPELVTKIISSENNNFNTGGQFLFIGQVRNDNVNGREVKGLMYSAYMEMAEKTIEKIENEIKSSYDLNCLHISHSLGKVNAGEISFLVFASSSHRKEIFELVQLTVDRIKKEVPIWKKDLF